MIDLRDPTEAGRWVTINDPVMGGLSDSNVTATADGLTFAGSVSLDNNGGFASARREPDPVLGAAAAGASTVRVDATGDGKTYVVQLRTAGDPWAYIQRFATQAGVSATYDLPVEGFEPVDLFLEPAPDAPAQLDPSTVDQVTIYILDKQDGPFSITLEAIELRR
ncbi:MAG: CIA30 family protein [Acidimicrobiales bacterium]|nr:CIA30 family protein [Acidimicrobiales bacterium]